MGFPLGVQSCVSQEREKKAALYRRTTGGRVSVTRKISRTGKVTSVCVEGENRAAYMEPIQHGS
jgi:hypothetical protein